MDWKYNAQRTRNIFDPKSKEPFRLSRSRLELFVDCPRCFYLDRRLGTDRPPGFPFTLNSAVDTLLKKEFDPRKDPKTKEEYAYEVRGENAFALCAVFEKETRGKRGYPYPERPVRVPVDFEKPEPEFYIENSDWGHEAGEACFERSIIKAQKET